MQRTHDKTIFIVILKGRPLIMTRSEHREVMCWAAAKHLLDSVNMTHDSQAAMCKISALFINLFNSAVGQWSALAVFAMNKVPSRKRVRDTSICRVCSTHTLCQETVDSNLQSNSTVTHTKHIVTTTSVNKWEYLLSILVNVLHTSSQNLAMCHLNKQKLDL